MLLSRVTHQLQCTVCRFVACGVLYLIGDVTSKSGASIEFAYDLFERRRLAAGRGLRFSSPFQMTTMLAYNPRDRRLYGWDNGNQLTYPLLTV